MDTATQTLLISWEAVRTWITSLAFYVQAATIAAALLIAFVISGAECGCPIRPDAPRGR